MALEALKKITEIKHEEISQTLENEDKEVVVPKTKYLFFFIGEKKYSIWEKQILNVLKNVKLYYFPFAPDFIDGVINFHNAIYPVVNYEKLMHESAENSVLELNVVVENSSGKFAIRVSGIDDFYMVPDESCSDEYVYFNDEKIPVLNIENINQSIISSCHKEAK